MAQGHHRLPQRFPRKHRQHEAGLVDLLAVVPAELLLFLQVPASQRLFHIPWGVFAAHHEANLAGRVGGDGGVGVFDHGEDFFAVGLEFGN